MSDRIKIDARGEQCPMPVVKAKKVLDRAVRGDVIEIHVDNDMAVQNLGKMANSQNCPSSHEQVDSKHYIVRIEAGGDGSAAAALQADPETAAAVGRRITIAVIDSAAMGSGDEKLGRILMKGFVYALGQLDELPAKILLYNSGIFLTTEGSDSLADLKSMQAQGVEIFSCGTCLDFYERKDKLLVGDISNMYQIVEAMAQADHVMRP